MYLASALYRASNLHNFFEGIRRVVSIWKFVRMYRPGMVSRNKISGSGVTSYPTYLDPLVPIFGVFSLWRPATSVQMNDYARKLNRFFFWIFSIDWYLNWPHWAFISWIMVHEQVVKIENFNLSLFKNFFLLSG